MRRSILLLFIALTCSIATNAQEAILDVLKDELDREFKVFSQKTPAAYYLDYNMKKTSSQVLTSSFGEITNEYSYEDRIVVPTMRVGDRHFDNTHVNKGKRARMKMYPFKCPVGGEEIPTRLALWNGTQQVYEDATNEYRSKKNNIKVEDSEKVDDMSIEEPNTYFEEENTTQLSEAQVQQLKKMMNEASTLFLKDPDMLAGDVSFRHSKVRSHFVSSEGHKIAQNHSIMILSVSGGIRSTEDGNQIRLYKDIQGRSFDELIASSDLKEMTSALVDKLIELKSAPIAEPYNGPAILSAKASGVFFHEIFGHRIEGHRFRDLTNANTFKDKLGELVLPKELSVTFDPQLTEFEGTVLNGHYKYDDEGVLGQRVEVVKDGVLKEFLMSRTPSSIQSKSNGHGRKDNIRQTVSRQSNMLVTTSKPIGMEKMRKELKKLCKKQGLEYGYFFQRVTGGFTNTSRFAPNAFNVTPTEVYRVYVDGRPDELVRGVSMIGTPLSMFSTVLKAGEDMDIFNGTCGAESGGVPVSCVSPSLLVGNIETQKKSQKYSTGPILQAPRYVKEDHVSEIDQQ